MNRTRQSLPAVFMRGGTSKGLLLLARDLPKMRDQWSPIFLSAMGSPDASGRQLDGMGGGASSLSKICVIGPPTRLGADVDFTFAQVLVKEAQVDYKGNCGNMIAAAGPFAVEEGLVKVITSNALVRIHNTNMRKLVHAHFRMRDGRVREDGDLVVPGVPGSGSPIRLDYLDPGGATTGKLLPTGRVTDTLEGLQVSLVDAGNACVFVAARDLGLRGNELPEELEADAALMQRLHKLRAAASVAMGIAPDPESARRIRAVPYLGIVSPAQPGPGDGAENLQAADMDLSVRVLAGGYVHRALPLTVALCAAVAARIGGSLPQQLTSKLQDETVRLGTPSGVIRLGSEVVLDNGEWRARSGSYFRTARRLFSGQVHF